MDDDQAIWLITYWMRTWLGDDHDSAKARAKKAAEAFDEFSDGDIIEGEEDQGTS